MAQYTELEIAQMIQTAREHMDLAEYDEAESLADELLQEEAEEGFPLKAGIYALKEEPEKAIELLKEGIDKNPESWRLKLELGNLYGQLGDTSIAMTIFDEALTMPGVESHWIELNRGIAFLKANQVDEALNHLQQIDHPAAINEAFSVQLEILDMINRQDLIINMAEDEQPLLSPPESTDDMQTLANIYGRIATAFWYVQEENESSIQQYLQTAKDLDRTNDQVLWLIREMDQEYSDEAHIYEILLQGEVVVMDEEEAEHSIPFTSVYVVLEDSPEQALERIKDYEIEAIDKSSLEVIEITSETNEEEEPLGIYIVGELMFIDGEAKEGQSEAWANISLFWNLSLIFPRDNNLK